VVGSAADLSISQVLCNRGGATRSVRTARRDQRHGPVHEGRRSIQKLRLYQPPCRNKDSSGSPSVARQAQGGRQAGALGPKEGRCEPICRRAPACASYRAYAQARRDLEAFLSQKFRQERRQSRQVVKDGSMPWSDVQGLQDRLREADDALERAQAEAAQQKRSTGFGRSM
jgi:hypothetical protein